MPKPIRVKKFAIATYSSLGGWVKGSTLVKDFLEADRYDSRDEAERKAESMGARTGLEYSIDRIDVTLVWGDK